MKRTLVTGANGFIGRHCLRALQKSDDEIHIVSSRPVTEERRDVNFHTVDLFDPTQTAKLLERIKPDQLLHLAWYSEPQSFWTAPENIAWVEASAKLIEAFARFGGKRVVVAGTCAEYDWRGDGVLSEYEIPLNPATTYGKCKHELHLRVESLAKEFGLSAAWARLFFLFGPHEHPERLVPSVINSLMHGDKTRCTHGQQLRDFLSVADVGSALVALLEGEVTGAVNIGSGEAVSVRYIVNAIARKLGREDLVQFGDLPSPANEPPLLVADITRLTEEVGWLPQCDLSTALDETIRWWQEQSTRQKSLERT